MTPFIYKATSTNNTNYSCHTKAVELTIIWDPYHTPSYHQLLLASGMDTDMQPLTLQTRSIARNQACAGHTPACTWFKNLNLKGSRDCKQLPNQKQLAIIHQLALATVSSNIYSQMYIQIKHSLASYLQDLIPTWVGLFVYYFIPAKVVIKSCRYAREYFILYMAAVVGIVSRRGL